MKKTILLAGKILTAFLGIFLCACESHDEPSTPPAATDGDDYCLMYYCSGGDKAHDLSFMSAVRSAAEASTDKVTVTCLFKGSGQGESEAHNGIRRYKAENGSLTVDGTFSASENFEITDCRNLTEFIKWSASTYPGRKYILVMVGHGLTFTPQFDCPQTVSRATVADGDKNMASYKVAEGIRNSGVHLSAMIAHFCQQGSIEMLAEWEGLTDYLLGSPFSIPDVAQDYASLVNDLSNSVSLEESLKRTARRTINLWQEYHDYGYFGGVIEVSRLSDLSGLWAALNDTFKYMKASVDGVSDNTDAPAVFGEKYGAAYLRALLDLTERKDPVFEYVRPDASVDLMDYLRNAFIYTGYIKLASYVNRVQEEIDKTLVYHR